MTGTGENSRVIKQGEKRSISSMLYTQKCARPGKQTAKTATTHMFTHLQHHSNYSAVVGQLIQIGYCNGRLSQNCVYPHVLQGRRIKKRTKGVREKIRSSSEVCKPFHETDNNLSESSQLRINGEASKGDPVVGVCCSSPDQG